MDCPVPVDIPIAQRQAPGSFQRESVWDLLGLAERNRSGKATEWEQDPCLMLVGKSLQLESGLKFRVVYTCLSGWYWEGKFDTDDLKASGHALEARPWLLPMKPGSHSYRSFSHLEAKDPSASVPTQGSSWRAVWGPPLCREYILGCSFTGVSGL